MMALLDGAKPARGRRRLTYTKSLRTPEDALMKQVTSLACDLTVFSTAAERVLLFAWLEEFACYFGGHLEHNDEPVTGASLGFVLHFLGTTWNAGAYVLSYFTGPCLPRNTT